MTVNTDWNMNDVLMKVAAQVFHREPDEISLQMKQDETEEWTSFAHIALVTILEEQHGFVIPIEEVEHLLILEDFLQYAEK